LLRSDPGDLPGYSRSATFHGLPLARFLLNPPAMMSSIEPPIWDADTQPDEGLPPSFLEEAYPTPLDTRIEVLLALFERAGQAARERMMRAPITTGRVRLLLRYVDRMAALALVEGNERYLRLGRVALLFLGQRAPHSSLMPLHLLLCRTARLLDEAVAA
jgi:hypothetical protein